MWVVFSDRLTVRSQSKGYTQRDMADSGPQCIGGYGSESLAEKVIDFEFKNGATLAYKEWSSSVEGAGEDAPVGPSLRELEKTVVKLK